MQSPSSLLSWLSSKPELVARVSSSEELAQLLSASLQANTVLVGWPLPPLGMGPRKSGQHYNVCFG